MKNQIKIKSDGFIRGGIITSPDSKVLLRFENQNRLIDPVSTKQWPCNFFKISGVIIILFHFLPISGGRRCRFCHPKSSQVRADGKGLCLTPNLPPPTKFLQLQRKCSSIALLQCSISTNYRRRLNCFSRD